MWGPRVLFWEDFYLKLAQNNIIWVPCGAHMCCSGIISIQIAQNNTYRSHVRPIWVCLGQYLFESTIMGPIWYSCWAYGSQSAQTNPIWALDVLLPGIFKT